MIISRVVTSAAIALCAGFLVGCPGLSGSAPIPRSDVDVRNRRGLTYHLPQDVAVVTVKATTGDVVAYDKDKKKLMSTRTYATSTTLEVKTIADTDHFFTLELSPAGLRDQTLKIKVTEDGLLTSSNFAATDKAAETLVSVARAVASIAGAAVGLNVNPMAGVNSFIDAPVEQKVDLLANAQAKLNQRVANLVDDEMKEYLKRQPPLVLLFISQSEIGAMLFHDMYKADKALDKANAELNAILRASTTLQVTKDKESDPYPLKVSAHQQLVSVARQHRDAAKESFQAALSAFTIEKKIGAPAKEEVATRFIDLADFPPNLNVKRLISAKRFPEKTVKQDEDASAIGIDNLDWDEIRCMSDISKESEVWQLFEKFKVLIVIDDVASTPSCPIDIKEYVKSHANARIYYRTPSPIMVRIYGMVGNNYDEKKPGSGFRLKLQSEQMASIVKKSSPLAYFEYEKNDFTNQNLGFVFVRGRLSEVDLGNSAGIASLAKGVADASDTAQSTFESSTTRAKNIAKTRQDIALNELNSQVNALKARKEYVDAQIALQGATSNRDLVAEKAAIDARLAVLNSQFALQKTEGTYDAEVELALLNAQLNLAKAQGGFEAALQQSAAQSQVDILKLQVELLKQQVEMLKQKMDLEDLQSKP